MRIWIEEQGKLTTINKINLIFSLSKWPLYLSDVDMFYQFSVGSRQFSVGSR
jgi:hypothetical protein